MFRVKDTRGHYLVEVAIILPIVIIFTVSIGFLMRVTSFDERMMHAMTDEGRRIMIDSYLLDSKPLNSLILRERIKKENDNLKAITSCDVYSDEEDSNRIKVHVTGQIEPRFPIKFKDNFQVKNQVLCRAFVGGSSGDEMGYALMESEGSSNLVYIFTEYGERYHKKNCTYVKAKPTRTILDKHVKKKYNSCPTCNSQKADIGTIVYCFEEYGEAYHLAGCSTIKKNITAIEEAIAIKLGYTNCTKCG